MTLSELTTVSESLVLVPAAAGGRPGLFAMIIERLRSTRASGIAWSIESVSAGKLAAFMGRSQDLLVVTFEAFPEHLVLIGARDLGTAIAVSYSVAVRECLSRNLRRALLFGWSAPQREQVGSELSGFAAMDLAAKIALVRSALDDALQSLASQDEHAPAAFAQRTVSALEGHEE